MTSGKQTKRKRARQAAAPPPAVRRKGERRASPKVLVAALIALAVVGTAVGVALALTGRSSSKPALPARGSLVGALPNAGFVERLFSGIPQTGNTLGRAKAHVTLVEYIDLQCPGCQAFETQLMPYLVQNFVRPGKLRVEARPIVVIGPDSERGRLATIAAGRQDKLFNYAEVLYVNQGGENTGWLNDDMVGRAAASVPGLDVSRLMDDRGSGVVSAAAKRYDTLATADNVGETPTLLVGKTGGTLRKVTAAELVGAIRAALRG